VTLGNKCSVSGLSGCSLDVDFNGVVYTVPTGCGTKNYPIIKFILAIRVCVNKDIKMCPALDL
jgi:hypothetical protein